MRKKFLYIKPINLEDQIEDKINNAIPIKTEESLSYFQDKINSKFDMNNNYFKLFSKKIEKNGKDKMVVLNNKKNINYLIKLKKANNPKNNEFKGKNLIFKTINQKINKQNEYKEYNSLTFRNNNFISNVNKDEETKKKLLNQRAYLHKIYNHDKRIDNYSYKKLPSSLTIERNNEKEKNEKSLNIKTTRNKKIKKEHNKTKKNKDKNKEEPSKLSMYDPASKSLRYKHYTENRIFNQTKNKLSLLNKQKMFQYYLKNSLENSNNSNHFNKYLNTKVINEINYMNQSLLKHRKENEINLAKFKKLLFKKKIESNHIDNKDEESKMNNNENEQKIIKVKINEKIKNLINNERKKLEESIDKYNKKLKINFNKKDLLFKILNKNKSIHNLTEVNIDENCKDDINFDNIHILTNFHFNRKTNII